MKGLTTTTQVHFRQGRGTRKVMKQGEEPAPVVSEVPRISRLMALATHMQELIDCGEVADYAELARLAHVSRARISQIMNLTLLAPDLQEAILFLSRTDGHCARIRERHIRAICPVRDWRLFRATLLPDRGGNIPVLAPGKRLSICQSRIGLPKRSTSVVGATSSGESRTKAFSQRPEGRS